MRNLSPPDSPDARADRAFPNSPMLRRIEADQTDRSMRRIGRIATAVAAAAVVTLGTIYSDVLKSYFGFGKGGSASNSGEFLSGPCPPGDLACMDERYYEEHGFPFSHGDPDGCVLSTPDEQLKSPLCCPGVAVDPSACPPLDEMPPDASGGDPQDSEILPGGVNEPTKKNKEPMPSPPPSPAIPPRKIDDPFGDSGVELPG